MYYDKRSGRMSSDNYKRPRYVGFCAEMVGIKRRTRVSLSTCLWLDAGDDGLAVDEDPGMRQVSRDSCERHQEHKLARHVEFHETYFPRSVDHTHNPFSNCPRPGSACCFSATHKNHRWQVPSSL